MLGKTADGLFWMFRYLERNENTARLLDAGFRIALTRAAAAENEWASVITTIGVKQPFMEKYERMDTDHVIDFLLRDPSNPSSVMSMIQSARDNARLLRTALTRELWSATNECWLTLKELLAHPVRERELPFVLSTIQRQNALLGGTLHGTMMRNDIFNFARLGTFLERADNTARILDVKYYLLLPSVSLVGSSVDNIQWETILRSVSAQRSYHRLHKGDVRPREIANFLMLDLRMPRSLAFCYSKIVGNLTHLAKNYEVRQPCFDQAETVFARLTDRSIEDIFESGLHEFIQNFIQDNNILGRQIEKDYRFYG